MLNKQTILKALLGGALFLTSGYLLTTNTAIAQDTTAAVHPNVAISAEFPKAVAGVTPDLISGRTNKIKVTLHNSGPHDLTVKMIVGSVAEMNDFTTVTHNLTTYKYDKPLKAHSALVLPYTIKVAHPAREVGLTLLAEMVDPTSLRHSQFQVLIYNSTVHFTQPASSWLDWKLILGSMLLAGAITTIVMTGMSTKNKYQSDPKRQHEKLVESKDAPKMDPMDRYAALARMKADDTPQSDSKTKAAKKDTNATETAAPKMSAMERYAALSEMKAKDGKPLPELKNKPTTATTDFLTGGEPFGILSQMKAMESEKNTEPESKHHRAPQMNVSSGGGGGGGGVGADRFEALADMKATRGDDVLNPERDMSSTRAL
ncbi:hypothetical protein BGZ95_006915 [Linnemannia exigua]|uniref:Translocon-associated protein subunit alpha n=1 Tax=Linnemannia exigua TaxID=604196 RepID=A0AAD4DFR2_9FUNG|nr:hypothetical protein BGZ95_006915 [Linnemannia exigua]